jgi:hypothetical protein
MYISLQDSKDWMLESEITSKFNELTGNSLFEAMLSATGYPFIKRLSTLLELFDCPLIARHETPDRLMTYSLNSAVIKDKTIVPIAFIASIDDVANFFFGGDSSGPSRQPSFTSEDCVIDRMIKSVLYPLYPNESNTYITKPQVIYLYLHIL